MSKPNTFESDLLKLIFQAVAIANLADNAAAGPLTNLYVSLHTADPGEAGDQTTSETAYTGYARIPVVRSAAGWTVSGATQVANAAQVAFGACTAGTSTLTHCGVGTSLAGAGKLLYSGALSAQLIVNPGITPAFAVGQLVITED